MAATGGSSCGGSGSGGGGGSGGDGRAAPEDTPVDVTSTGRDSSLVVFDCLVIIPIRYPLQIGSARSVVVMSVMEFVLGKHTKRLKREKKIGIDREKEFEEP